MRKQMDAGSDPSLGPFHDGLRMIEVAVPLMTIRTVERRLRYLERRVTVLEVTVGQVPGLTASLLRERLTTQVTMFSDAVKPCFKDILSRQRTLEVSFANQLSDLEDRLPGAVIDLLVQRLRAKLSLRSMGRRIKKWLSIR